MFVFDLGAHFGMFSLAAAHFGGRAVAVDPSPLAAKIMAAQVQLNHCADRVVVVQAAVSDKPGELHMLSAGVFSDGYFRLVKGRSQSELTQTPATTVDQITQQFGSPTHIKIDVEGHEAAVLRGARSTMENNSPMLFLELHNEMLAAEGGNPKDALDELERLGYRPFSLDGTALSGSTILDKPIVRVVARRGN